MQKESKYLIGAVILSTIGYLIPLYFGKAWLGLFIVLLIGASFLGVLVRFVKLNIDSRNVRVAFSAFAMVLIAFHALAFALDYGRKDYQKELLLEIRQTIEEGITRSAIQKELIYVLSEYHKQEEVSVVELAEQILADHFGEDGDFDEFPEQDEPEDAMSYYYELDEVADEVRVIGVSKVAPGSDPAFENYGRSTGMLELKLILNEGGVSYEVAN